MAIAGQWFIRYLRHRAPGDFAWISTVQALFRGASLAMPACVSP
jgi:hypothetical protein